MKVKAKFYRGIEYLVANDLPEEQRKAFERAGVEKIKILIDGKVVSECINYKHYAHWYHEIFFIERAEERKRKSTEATKILMEKK
jgi:hypothetical protein